MMVGRVVVAGGAPGGAVGSTRVASGGAPGGGGGVRPAIAAMSVLTFALDDWKPEAMEFFIGTAN